MIRQSVVSIVVVAAVVALSGCANTDAPPGPAGPTLSLTGARGVSADLRRTVTEVNGTAETIVSAVDTAVWAPFDDKGAALPSSPDAGLPGPVGWLSSASSSTADWSRYASFVDSAGTLHELRVSGKGRGLLRRMEYWRQGRLAVDYQGQWADVTGGWVLDNEAVTYHPARGPAIRINVTARQMRVAQAVPGADALVRAGAAFAGLLRPQPLAAQFYFGACNNEWLTWGGAALIAEYFWIKFAETKSYANFNRAMAATMAAGVALGSLVDCMTSQPEQPDPGR